MHSPVQPFIPIGEESVKEEIQTTDTAKGSGKKKSVLLEYGQSILIALVLALFIRTFVVQAFVIPSGSMQETLQIGDRILVNKFLYGVEIPYIDMHLMKIRDPERGDVVVFAYPNDPKEDFIKRVIGVPGDRIRIADKEVYVNGELYSNPHAQHTDSRELPAYESPRDNMKEITVPLDSYFVMGDNRDNSYDSRFWGFVKGEAIKGPAFMKYWSWDANNWRVRWHNLGELIR